MFNRPLGNARCHHVTQPRVRIIGSEQDRSTEFRRKRRDCIVPDKRALIRILQFEDFTTNGTQFVDRSEIRLLYLRNDSLKLVEGKLITLRQ